jgi:rubredoxin
MLRQYFCVDLKSEAGLDKDDVGEQLSDDRDQALVEAIATGVVTDIDGVMSPVSVAISRQLGATRFDMDSWWITTPHDWICPGCGRTKLQIARLNTRGEIMCRLAAHHDHMQDALKTRFQKFSVSRQKVVADQHAEDFAKRSAAMIAAYDPTLICVDCNNADVTAKQSAQAHDSFSFSPQELRRIVRPAPNVPHSIDHETAKAIWYAQRETFELRMKIANRMAEIAANNQHWFQPGDVKSSPKAIEKRANRFLYSYKKVSPKIFDVLKGPRDVPPKRPASAWRQAVHHAPRTPPTDNEIDHAGMVGNPKYWSLLPEHWECPGCNRSKRKIVRKNKKGEWVFPAGFRLFFNAELPPNSHDVLNCGDCAKVGEDLGKEAALRLGISFDGYAQYVKIDEVRQCIIPKPHSRHNINNEWAELILGTIVSRILEHLEPSEESWDEP